MKPFYKSKNVSPYANNSILEHLLLVCISKKIIEDIVISGKIGVPVVSRIVIY